MVTDTYNEKETVPLQAMVERMLKNPPGQFVHGLGELLKLISELPRIDLSTVPLSGQAATQRAPNVTPVILSHENTPERMHVYVDKTEIVVLIANPGEKGANFNDILIVPPLEPEIKAKAIKSFLALKISFTSSTNEPLHAETYAILRTEDNIREGTLEPILLTEETLDFFTRLEANILRHIDNPEVRYNGSVVKQEIPKDKGQIGHFFSSEQ